MRDKKLEQICQAVTKDLVDRGKLIEAGFVIFRTMAMPEDCHQAQIDDMQTAFMAGAQHLFASIMTTLDPGDDMTDADMRRLDAIGNELEEWRAKMRELIKAARSRADDASIKPH